MINVFRCEGIIKVFFAVRELKILDAFAFTPRSVGEQENPKAASCQDYQIQTFSI